MVTHVLLYTSPIPKKAEGLDTFNPSVMDWKYKHPIVIHRGTNGTGSTSHISVRWR